MCLQMTTCIRQVGVTRLQGEVECLRKMSTTQIMDLFNRTRSCNTAPTIDGEFIVEQPLDIAFGNSTISDESRMFFRSFDIITGVNNGEGALHLVFYWLNKLHQTRQFHTLI